MRNSITDRLKITSTGKVLRRARALGHSRSNKSSRQMKRKKNFRGINIPMSAIEKYAKS